MGIKTLPLATTEQIKAFRKEALDFYNLSNFYDAKTTVVTFLTEYIAFKAGYRIRE